MNGFELFQAMSVKAPARTKARLRAAAEEHMTRIESNSERVKAYFQGPHLKYAA